jgi:hypothetical protein
MDCAKKAAGVEGSIDRCGIGGRKGFCGTGRASNGGCEMVHGAWMEETVAYIPGKVIGPDD